MPKRNDGNEQDLRVRPELDAKSLDGDNPYDGNSCETAGEQVDLNPNTGEPCTSPPCEIDTPDGTLEFDWQDTAAVCPSGYSPLEVDKLYMNILKNHFSDPDKIMDPYLKDYTYSTISRDNNIRIVMNTDFDSTQPDTFPALVIKRGRQRMQRVVMGDRGEAGTPLQGMPHYVRFMQGSHRVLCLGQTDGHTERLAFEVFTLLNCLSPNIRSDLPMHDFQVSDLSEIGLIDDLGNTLGVAVESIYTYEYGWTLKEVAPTLHIARARTTVELEQVSLEQ
jgi:hypothetical protein